MTLRFVTTNPGKVREARAYLTDPVDQLDIDTTEIQHEKLGAVAAHKAREAYRAADEPVIVDDSGLFIDAFDGFPGPYSSYVYDTLGIERVWRLAEAEASQTAAFRAVVAYCDGETFDATPEPVDREPGNRQAAEQSPTDRPVSQIDSARRGQDLSADERPAATTDEQVRPGHGAQAGHEGQTLPVKLFGGVVPGEMVAPRGDQGFGYDPIFEYDGRTFAELDPDEKNAISHRGRALAKFAEWYETADRE
jgi:XTP/dITP diphosphohydrolase